VVSVVAIGPNVRRINPDYFFLLRGSKASQPHVVRFRVMLKKIRSKCEQNTL
jgi:hypothetical protein